MKKFILAMFLIFSSCSLTDNTSSIIDPAILKAIDGLLFTYTSQTSFIFFAEDQQVLIYENSNKKGSYYKLIDGKGSDSGAISFRLSGWGSFNNSYIAFKTLNENSIIYASISVQKTRNTAVNSIQFSSTPSTMAKSILLKSPALYTLATVSPIVKTSIAGIFKPSDSQFITFTYGDEDSLVVNGTITIQIKNSTTDETTTTKQDLVYQKNINSTTTIYSYNNSTSGEITLYGIRIDMKSAYPRLEIITKQANYSTLGSVRAELERDLSRITRWNYGIFDAIRVTDGSLVPFLDKIYLEYIPNLNTFYSVLEHSQWFLNSSEDTVRITKRSKNDYTEEDYLLAPTDKNGVFELIDHQAINTQEYAGKYFHIVAQDDIINKINIYDNLDNLNNPIATFLVKELSQLEAKKPFLFDSRNYNNVILGKNNDGSPINGRSSFKAYIEKSTGSIYLAGGYTNSQRFHRGVPRREKDQALLPPIYNNIYEIKNIDSIPVYLDTGLKLNQNNADNLNFQQPIGATTVVNSTLRREIFWLFGAGAIGIEKVSYNPLSPNTWHTSSLTGANFDNFYHQMMVSHLGELFILGGTRSDKGASGDIDSSEDLGTYTNKILVAPAVANMNANVWSVLTNKADWPSRIHGNVFSIGKTMVLVGGMLQKTTRTDATDPIIPTNDVWISENNGITWTKIHEGGTPITTAGAESAPPVQENSQNGPLAGTVLNGVIYLLAEDRTVYYSYNKGKTWYVAQNKFSGTEKIYGAQIIGYKNQLFLIGGQTALIPGDTTKHNMNEIINALRIQ